MLATGAHLRTAQTFRVRNVARDALVTERVRHLQRVRGHATGMNMHSATVGKSLRIFSYAVLLLMAAAIAYAGFITLKYWTGIAV